MIGASFSIRDNKMKLILDRVAIKATLSASGVKSWDVDDTKLGVAQGEPLITPFEENNTNNKEQLNVEYLQDAVVYHENGKGVTDITSAHLISIKPTLRTLQETTMKDGTVAAAANTSVYPTVNLLALGPDPTTGQRSLISTPLAQALQENTAAIVGSSFQSLLETAQAAAVSTVALKKEARTAVIYDGANFVFEAEEHTANTPVTIAARSLQRPNQNTATKDSRILAVSTAVLPNRADSTKAKIQHHILVAENLAGESTSDLILYQILSDEKTVTGTNVFAGAGTNATETPEVFTATFTANTAWAPVLNITGVPGNLASVPTWSRGNRNPLPAAMLPHVYVDPAGNVDGQVSYLEIFLQIDSASLAYKKMNLIPTGTNPTAPPATQTWTAANFEQMALSERAAKAIFAFDDATKKTLMHVSNIQVQAKQKTAANLSADESFTSGLVFVRVKAKATIRPCCMKKRNKSKGCLSCNK